MSPARCWALRAGAPVSGRHSRVTAPRQGTGASIRDDTIGRRLPAVVGADRPAGITELGTLSLASALDQGYAEDLAKLSKAQTVILSHDRVVASTLPRMALKPEMIRANVGQEGLSLADSEYAVQLLLDEGDAQVYVLDSINASAGPVIQGALRTMGWIALGAFALAALASVWLSRTIAARSTRCPRRCPA